MDVVKNTKNVGVYQGRHYGYDDRVHEFCENGVDSLLEFGQVFDDVIPNGS